MACACVSFGRDATAGRSGSVAPGCGRRAGLRGALSQRRLEPVAAVLDRGGGGGRRGFGLGAATTAAVTGGGRVLRVARRVRRLAGRVDRLVDPAEPLL